MTLLTDADNNVEVDPTILAELVDEAKKDPEGFARRKYNSDTYIKTIERNQDMLRQDFLKAKEEIAARAALSQIAALEQADRLKAPLDNLTPPVKEAPQPTQLDIESLVSSKILESETKKKHAENYDLVKRTLREKLGPNYQAHLTEQIEALGLTDDFVTDLAKKHPTVLFKTLGLDQAKQVETYQAPPRNSSTFTPKGAQKRTWTYYQEMRKTKPNLFYDPKINIQMQKDHQALGNEFEDGDFHAYG